MAQQFNFKVDLNKVSKSVKQFVENVAKSEGSKKRIDTDNEYNLLSQYLSGGAATMNKDEIGYIQGFMFEYQDSKAKEFEENSVTTNTKKEVSKIAKRMGDKKTIDSDEEAQALVTLLKDTHNDLNMADKVYIQNLLIKSGYANYLQPKRPDVTVVNVTVNEIFVEEDTNEKECEPIQAEKNEVQKKYNPPKTRVRKPKLPDKVVPKDKDKKEKPTIAEEDRNKGFGLADRIVHELNSHIANNNVIKNALSEVNSKNAYSFVGKFISAAKQGVNKGVFSISDLFNKLSYKDTLQVMEALCAQAQSIGLDSNYAFHELSDEINFANRLLEENPNADPTKETIRKADKAIQDLYNEMSKVYE